MIKTREEIDREFYNKFSLIAAVKNEQSGNSYMKITDFLHSIRENDFKEMEDWAEKNQWIEDAIKRDEFGGTGKETAKIITDDLLQFISTLKKKI